MDTTIAEPQTQAVEAKTLTAIEQAKAMTITTNLELARADGFCVALKELEREIVGTFADAKAKAFAAHRAVTAAEAKHLEPVMDARKIVKTKMSSYQDEQEALRRAEERRLEAEARKKAEDEALAAAEAAERSGDTGMAEAIIQAPVEVAPVVLAKATPKTQTQIRKVWTYRVTNEAAVPRSYLMVDHVKLGQQARATQDSIKVPGVEFFQRPA